MWRFKSIEDDFLPESLKLEKTSASPVGRIIIWVIMLLFVCSLIWSAVGRIDIVSVAQGRIIPDGYSKPVQSIIAAKVKSLHVGEGDVVRQGQLLLELDNTQLTHEQDNIKQQLEMRKQEQMRLMQLLTLIDNLSGTSTGSSLDASPNVSLDKVANVRWQAFADGFNTRLQQKEKLIKHSMTIQHEIKKLEALTPIIARQLENQRTLADKKYISQQQFLESRKKLITLKFDLQANRARYQENLASIIEIEKLLKQSVSQFRHDLHTEKVDLEKQQLQLTTQLKKNYQQLSQTRLKASVSGVVQQLQIRNADYVVKPAENLMLIVPSDSQYRVEAFIENKDIGFIEEGALVEIKIDGFPFTRYGVIHGVVELISADSITDKNVNSAYKAIIKIAEQHLNFADKKLPLSAGMNVQAEIITGQRTVLDYFLSPLVKQVKESIRER